MHNDRARLYDGVSAMHCCRARMHSDVSALHDRRSRMQDDVEAMHDHRARVHGDRSAVKHHVNTTIRRTSMMAAVPNVAALPQERAPPSPATSPVQDDRPY